MEDTGICARCGKSFPQNEVGRPRKTCSEKCKHALKRARRAGRIDELASAAVLASQPGDPICRVCGVEPATVGFAGTRILCVICSGTNPGQSAGPE